MNVEQARERIKTLLEATDAPLQPLPDADREMVIYGAGKCGRDALAVLQRHGYQIAGFLDERSASIGSVGGIGCIAPDSEGARLWAAANLPVVLAVFNYAADLRAIASKLEKKGFRRIISYYELFERFSESLSSRFWLAPRQFYRRFERELMECLALWSDETSRRIYLELLELRLTFNLNELRNPDLHHQYFPTDLPPLKQPLRFVDGGAYIGDTIDNLLRNGFSFDVVAAFEPDLENFRHLRQFVGAHRTRLGDVLLLPCGLGEETRQSRFESGRGVGSLLDEHGKSFIQVVKLDDVLPNFAPTFIKLDVEGAELAALSGAQEILSRSGPSVAVCLYHAAQHLWELPLQLRQFRPDYSFALRYHQFNGFETVAYAFRP